jgi:hypothetical protein
MGLHCPPCNGRCRTALCSAMRLIFGSVCFDGLYLFHLSPVLVSSGVASSNCRLSIESSHEVPPALCGPEPFAQHRIRRLDWNAWFWTIWSLESDLKPEFNHEVPLLAQPFPCVANIIISISNALSESYNPDDASNLFLFLSPDSSDPTERTETCRILDPLEKGTIRRGKSRFFVAVDYLCKQ